MSTIRRFSVYTHCNDIGGKVWNPAIRWTKKYAVFVVLENDDGVQGLGECWCFDTAPDALVAFLRTEVSPHIIGCPIVDYPVVYTQLLNAATLTARHGMLMSALSGVDIAMWDIQSRVANKPLWRYLTDFNHSTNSSAKNSYANSSETSAGSVCLYGSGGLYGENKTKQDLADEMQAMTYAGFTRVKMKVGALSIESDIERVTAVLDQLGEKSRLIIDGVYSYSVQDALKLYDALPASKIEAFQSPIKASNIAGMHTLCEAGVPVMATEAEYRDEIHQQLLKQNSVKFLQTAPIACGGITRINELSSIIARGENTDVRLSLEVSSTAIAFAAACHCAAAVTQVAHTEYHYVHQVFMDDFPLQASAKRRGLFTVPDDVGLGIALSLHLVNKEYELTV